MALPTSFALSAQRDHHTMTTNRYVNPAASKNFHEKLEENKPSTTVTLKKGSPESINIDKVSTLRVYENGELKTYKGQDAVNFIKSNPERFSQGDYRVVENPDGSIYISESRNPMSPEQKLEDFLTHGNNPYTKGYELKSIGSISVNAAQGTIELEPPSFNMSVEKIITGVNGQTSTLTTSDGRVLTGQEAVDYLKQHPGKNYVVTNESKPVTTPRGVVSKNSFNIEEVGPEGYSTNRGSALLSSTPERKNSVDINNFGFEVRLIFKHSSPIHRTAHSVAQQPEHKSGSDS